MAEMTSPMATKFTALCARFDIKNKDSTISLAQGLDKISLDLAKSIQARILLGSDVVIWPHLRKLWKDLARAHSTFWDADESSEEENDDQKVSQQQALTSLCGSTAKITRNLVAGVPDNQSTAFINEPEIRRLLHYYTSWSVAEDEKSTAIARLLTQALSNIVTGRDDLMDRLWETYLNLPEDQVVIIRLLGSPDAKTLLSTLIFISNCVSESRKRTKLLCGTKIGIRICVCLLDNMLRLFEAGEGTAGAQAFDVGYTILTRIIEEGLAGSLYKRLTMQDEAVTPHQTTLLKIIDSYLQSNQSTAQTPIKPETLQIHFSISPMLARTFFLLSRYAQNSIHRSLGHDIKRDDENHPDQSDPMRAHGVESVSPPSTSTDNSGISGGQAQSPELLMNLDVMLPKVCEALVLVTQCIVTVAIEAEENAIQMDLQDDNSPKTNMKNYFNEVRTSGIGIVESLIELLQLLDLFLPRINFGLPVPSNGLSPNASIASPSQENTKGQVITGAEHHGFAYLKRDLVRMLGILCHEKKAVQDRTREVGGIEVVMNMCVIDDRNPYLREHAIFTLHNLLKDNPENQRVVDSIQPSPA